MSRKKKTYCTLLCPAVGILMIIVVIIRLVLGVIWNINHQ